MSSIIVQTLYFVASYVGLFIIIFGSLNWLTKNFLWAFLRVKSSQGKKILCKIHSPTDIYFSIGQLEDNILRFKRRDKKKSIISAVSPDSFYSMCGVFVIEHSEDAKTIFSKTGKISEGSDGRTTDNYLNRIIKSPQVEDKFRQIMIALMVVLLIGVGASLYFGFVIYDKLKVLQLAGVIQ